MSDTPPPPEQKEAAFFATIRGWGITRSPDGIIGGVAAGVGERIGLARVPARIILVIAVLILFGVVLLAYAAAWALLPDRDGNIVIQNFGRGITNVGALIGIAFLGLIGAFNLDHRWGNYGFNNGWTDGLGSLGRFDHVFTILFTLLAIGLGILVLGGLVFAIIYSVRRSKRNGAKGPGVQGDATNPAGDATGPSSAGEGPAADQERAPVPPAAATPGQPQPWEAALMPNDPAVSGATTASAADGHLTGGSVPPAPPRPPLRRVPGPGRRFYLITAAWILISIAIVAATERIDGLAVAPGLAWLALFTIGYGLILAAIAIAGRKLGFLGFLSVPLLIVGLLSAVNSGEVRDTYDSATDAFEAGSGYVEDGVVYDEFGNVIDGTPYEDPAIADPTAAFADDYQQIYVAQECYDWDSRAGAPEEERLPGEASDIMTSFAPQPHAPQPYAPQPYATQARLTYAEVSADTMVDITAEHTVLTIPAGTNVVLQADFNSQASVDWESRGLYCDFWGSGGGFESNDSTQDYLSLINPGAPTLTLAVHDDQFANTIEIHEAAPVASDPAPSAAAEPTASPEPTVTSKENQS